MLRFLNKEVLVTGFKAKSFSTYSYAEFQASTVHRNDLELQQESKKYESNGNVDKQKQKGHPKKFELKSEIVGDDSVGDLSLLENAYQKYEKKSLNSIDSTYYKSKIAPLETPDELDRYLKTNLQSMNFANFKNFNYLPIGFGLNQNIKSANSKENEKTSLNEIIKSFKHTPIKYSFAYGSKVFKQGAKNGGKQTDLILATTFSDHFHSLNLNKNPNHYSFLKMFGTDAISKIQNIGAGVYFNPYTKIDNNLVKYGVISVEDLLNDLLNWKNLYIAGRLQKPVKILKDDARVRFLNQINLKNAMSVSLLMMKTNETHKADLFQLFKTISSLSYTGDIRTKIGGENPKKIDNIVNNQYNEFNQLYKPFVEIFSNNDFIQFVDGEKNVYQINDSVEYKAQLIDELPFDFKRKLFTKYSNTYLSKIPDEAKTQILSIMNNDSIKPQIHDIFKTSISSKRSKSNFVDQKVIGNSVVEDSGKLSPSEYAMLIANDSHLSEILSKCLQETVFVPSLAQSIKGIFTAGLSKSWNYALEKRSKYKEGSK